MRFILCLVLVLSSSAFAINREQMQQAMDGEDLNEVMAKKPRKVAVSECSTSTQCKLDEVCYKASAYDAKGICVKKPKD